MPTAGTSVSVYKTFLTLTCDRRSLEQTRAEQKALNNAPKLDNKWLKAEL